MAGFANIAEYVNAFDAGRTHFCSFRKVPSQATVAGWWADLSMSAGNPLPNYYASSPLVAATLNGFRGVFHGDDKSPAQKHLSSLMLVTQSSNALGQYQLLDYLLYYPFIDGDSSDSQGMDNTVTLPRYASGDGVRAMAVAVAPTNGSGQFTYVYEDQDGNEQTSPVQYCSTTAAGISSLLTSQQAVANAPPGAFLSMASGSRGIRKIKSVQFGVANGGLMCIVLVKPLADIALYEASTPNEVDFIRTRPGPPRIYDGAYLNFIYNGSTLSAATVVGAANFVWSA